MRRNKIFISLGVLGLLVVAVVLSLISQPEETLGGPVDQPWAVATVRVGNGGKETLTYSASSNYSTSTQSVGLTTTDTASTTIIATISGSKSFDFNLCGKASTTSAVLHYRNYFSTATDTPSITWMQETSSTADSATQVSHGFLGHTFTWATTTDDAITGGETNHTRCVNILTSPVGAKSVLIKLGVRTANMTLWPQIIPVNEF